MTNVEFLVLISKMTHDDRSIRFAAESLYQNANNMYRQYPSIDFCKHI